MLVTDTSVSAEWFFPDESSEYADNTYATVEAEGGLVPQHWHFEMRSAFLRAERRDRLSAGEVNARLLRLAETTEEMIETDESPDLDAAFALAREYRLSFYDALYLELAMRRGLLLATLDSALERAAIAEGVLAML